MPKHRQAKDNPVSKRRHAESDEISLRLCASLEVVRQDILDRHNLGWLEEPQVFWSKVIVTLQRNMLLANEIMLRAVTEQLLTEGHLADAASSYSFLCISEELDERLGPV